MRGKNLALVGFMGSGKSTVGRRAAERLGLAFVDSDRLIEARAGKRIPEIFAEDGEAAFRSLEREAIALLASESRLVIATGGGAFADPANREALARTAFVAYLEAPFELLWNRAIQSGDRPLLAGEDGLSRAKRLYEERLPHYRLADATIDAARPIEDVVKELIEVYRAHVGAHR